MGKRNMEKIDFDKNSDGLVPAIIQDYNTKNVLMLGYMNQESYQNTIETKKVTFYSRSKERMWTKWEESGNFLNLVDIKLACNNDTLLVNCHSVNPVCFKRTECIWGQGNEIKIG